uniref:hypothetical protein n=1 Tax=Polaromonas sp. E3S TaxID=1840265 RepID=UPI002102D354|nr:hypothetical protein [Polaromonas sp. E3S]
MQSDGSSRDEQTHYACGFATEPLFLEELDGVCINFVPGKHMTVKSLVARAAPLSALVLH